MHALIIGLRIVHVVAGVFWAGTAFFINILLLPSLGAAGPAGGTVMTELKRRRQHDLLGVTSALTIISGLALLWITSSGLNRSWLRAPFGMTLIIGGVAALAGFVLGLVVVRPLAVHMEQIQSELATASTAALRNSHLARLGAVKSRLVTFGRLSSGCIGVAVLAMAVARYL